MAKYSLAISSDDPNELSRIIVALGGVPIIANGDDDDGPADINAPTIDTRGIPWDARIHAGSKKQNQDGTWKRKGRIDDAFYNSVVMELSQRSQPQQMQPMQQSFIPQSVSAPAGVVVGTYPQMQQQPMQMQQPQGGVDWNSFGPMLNERMAAGKINVGDLTAFAQQYGQADIAFLAQPQNQHLIQAFINAMAMTAKW